MKKNKRMK